MFGPALGPFDSDLLSQPEPSSLSAEVSDITLTDGLNVSPGRSPLEPPSWRTHANSDRDVLEDVSRHKKSLAILCMYVLKSKQWVFLLCVCMCIL